MISTLKKIYRGQTLTRILMNSDFRSYTISGKVVDVGGGRSPDYFSFLKKENVASIKALDGSLSGINFEKDPLPYPKDSIDTVLLCNVLEHIYHYKFLTDEIYRIIKPGGKMIGFVPFLINYHPDPHDYFRYTKESLHKIFSENGFKEISIKELGFGPFSVNYNNIVLSIPRPLRVLLFPFYHCLDKIFLYFRPKIGSRYPIGYSFVVKK